VASADARVATGTAVNDKMEFTGERFIPGTRGEIWVEHWHRYYFAARWAQGREVLDVACGEGYGTALLADRGARRLTGVDLSPQAIAHARSTYSRPNVEFVEASCTRMPFADASFDLVVSFETLEHIDTQREFLDEVARVLRPEGVFLLSCPNKLEYSDKRGFANEFHVKELYREELAALVSARFPALQWYGQRPSFFSVIAPEGASAAAADLREVSETDPARDERALAHPLYFLLAASRSRAAIDALPPMLSVLSDRDDWVHQDYEKVMRDLGGAAKDREVLRAIVKERDDAIGFMQRDIEAWKAIKAELEALLERTRADHERESARLGGALAERNAVIESKDREIARRGGLRYWLMLPLYRFGIVKHPPV
jgi:SAM-dependent methyltransferase